MREITYIKQQLMDDMLTAARAAPRRRKNHNFHDDFAHPCQRLINAVLPEAYIQPHRHLDPRKEEMLIILRGRFGMVFFDDAGRVTQTALLDLGGDILAVNIPTGIYHTGVALGDGAVIFEAKAGPYAPHSVAEAAPFAPVEGATGAPEYLAKLKALFGAPA